MFTRLSGVSVIVMVTLALALLGGIAYLIGNGMGWDSIGLVLLIWSVVMGLISLRE